MTSRCEGHVFSWGWSDLGACPWHPGAQLGSLLLIQSHWLQRSSLMFLLWSGAGLVRGFPDLWAAWWLKSPQPTLHRANCGSPATWLGLKWRVCRPQPFPLVASSTWSSGFCQVQEVDDWDQSIKSGLRVVVTICEGTVNVIIKGKLRCKNINLQFISIITQMKTIIK